MPDLDPMDMPEGPTHVIAVPFVLCTSVGGRFDDDAFVAGFECGMVDTVLGGAAPVVRTVRVTLRTELLPQHELCAMYRGFPIMNAEPHPEQPEWCDVVFERGADG